MAIQLSLQMAQGGVATDAPGATDAAPQAAPNPFAALFAPAAAAPAPQQPPQQQPQQQQHQQPVRRPTRAPAPSSGSGAPVQQPLAAAPGSEWWESPATAAGAAAAGDIPTPDPAAACAALAEILGAPVAAPGVPAPTGGSAGVGATIQMVFARGGVTDKILDAVVRTRFSPGRLRSKAMCVELGECHARAVAMQAREAAAEAAPTSVRAALAGRTRTKLARHMLAQLEDDGDDLYFEGGRHRGRAGRAYSARHVT